MADSLTIRRPDDWHVHLRDDAMLRGVVAYTAAQFARAIVMPNLSPPVTTAAQARAYRERIMAALPSDARFEPLMTAYLTDDTDPADLVAGKAEGVFTAAKLYPANATTNSAHGVSNIARLAPVFAAMEECGLVLCVHGEVTDPEVDVFDREAVFIVRVFEPPTRAFPEL
jgi:dihydroorotase